MSLMTQINMGSMAHCPATRSDTAKAAVPRRAKPLKVMYGLGIDEHDTEGRLICAEYPTHYGATSRHATKASVAKPALSMTRRIEACCKHYKCGAGNLLC